MSGDPSNLNVGGGTDTLTTHSIRTIDFYSFKLLEWWSEKNKNKITDLKDVWMSTSKFAKHSKINVTHKNIHLNQQLLISH